MPPSALKKMVCQTLTGRQHPLGWLKLRCDDQYQATSGMSEFFTVLLGHIFNLR
jgi:hypothetical protein